LALHVLVVRNEGWTRTHACGRAKAAGYAGFVAGVEAEAGAEERFD
jgi:hypothetical protein